MQTHRLTHILRPSVTRPDPAARATLAMSPQTDLDFSLISSHNSDLPSSLSDVQSTYGASDVLSDADFESDPELPEHPHRRQGPRGHHSGRRSRAGDRGTVTGEHGGDAAPHSTSHGYVSYASQDVRPPSPRTLGIVTIVLACAQEATSSASG